MSSQIPLLPTAENRRAAARELERRNRAQSVVATSVDPERFEQYCRDPSAWVDDFTDLTLHGYQRDVLDLFKEHDRVAVRGPHGLGKTFTGSVVVWWFSTTSVGLGVDWKCASTATAWRQLTKFLWPEIRRLAKHIDWDALGIEKPRRHVELLDLSLKLGDGEAFAAASDDETNLEGVHGKRVLYVYDEAKGIPRETWEATEGAFSNAGPETDYDAFAFGMSTPGAPIGEFYDIHKGRRSDWYPVHVTLEQTIEAGQNSAEWAAKRKTEWGETSAVYQNRVLGNFAANDEDSLIPLSWVEQSMEAWREYFDDGNNPSGAPRFGVDVARHGKDKTVTARKVSNVIVDIEAEDYTDSVTELGDRVALKMGRMGSTACVDADGMGAGTADRLRTLKGDSATTVFHGNGHDEWTDATGELTAFNNRSAAWYDIYQALNPENPHRLLLPPSDELLGDLTGPRLVNDSGGKIKLESKDQTKRRLGRSPDYGDAVVMANWSPPPEPPAPNEWVGTDGGSEIAATYRRTRGR